jgi:hypothetical protein
MTAVCHFDRKGEIFPEYLAFTRYLGLIFWALRVFVWVILGHFRELAACK